MISPDLGGDLYLQLNHLVSHGVVQAYAPLFDQRGSMTAQFVGSLYIVQELSGLFSLAGTHDFTSAKCKGGSKPRRRLLVAVLSCDFTMIMMPADTRPATGPT